MLLLGVMAHVCLSLKVTLFMHGGQALVDRKRAHILIVQSFCSDVI